MNRAETFDLDTTKFILSDLAKFHGTAIGMKLKNPEEFGEKIKAVCTPFHFGGSAFKMWIEHITLFIQENPQCAPFVETVLSFFQKRATVPREPYATLAHCDLWVNNTMQLVKSGKVTKNVFVDFQIWTYRSCASDVFFFLWTSVQHTVLAEHLDNLIKYYHDQLVATVQELNCDTSDFSLDKFYNELKIEANYEFGHAFLFCFSTRNPAFSVTDSEANKKSASSVEEFSKKTPFYVKEFLWFMITECNKRGWLY